MKVLLSLLLIFFLTASSLIVEQTVPDHFTDATERAWQALESKLTASRADLYVLDWQGLGGDVYYAEEFITAVIAARAKGKEVDLNITGGSYSAHALVACYVNKIKFTSGFLMFHGDSDLQNRRYPRSQSMITRELKQCVRVGLLTEYDVNKMYSGYEVYRKGNQTWYKKDLRKVRS